MRVLIHGLLLFLACYARGVELIEQPSVELTRSNAVIHWITDVPCGTRVRVEPTGARITVTEGKAPATHHSVSLGGLQPTTRYTVALGTAKVWLATNVFTATGSSLAQDTASTERTFGVTKAPQARKTWGNYSTLPDHFARHGADFHARDAEDYARMAWEFRQRA